MWSSSSDGAGAVEIASWTAGSKASFTGFTISRPWPASALSRFFSTIAKPSTIDFASGVVVTPSFGLARFEESVELRLGQALEFRSGLELAYEMRSGWRVGLALYHLSNAGLARENPGSEGLVVSISLPTD